MRSRLKRIFHTVRNHGNDDILKRLDVMNMLAARCYFRQIKNSAPLEHLSDAEFKVFSQFGDDGIVQYLVHEIPIDCPVFIEFGVEDYSESNTRFLLINNNWRGLIIDADPHNVKCIMKSSLYWQHDLTAVAAMVDAEGVNKIFGNYGFTGEIGILSIDIDGNDFWVWKAINIISPILVIVEYNGVFGGTRAVTVPYKPDFDRNRAHFSRLYWGASLEAFRFLADEKGYTFVGSNSAGNNAYFVRNDRSAALSRLARSAGYVASRYRESRDESGQLSYLSGDDRLRAVRDLPIYDVKGRTTKAVSEVFGIAP